MIPCIMAELPPEKKAEADALAVSIRPENRRVMTHGTGAEARAAVSIARFWGNAGVHLTVGFLESIPTNTKDRIINAMNAWSACGNVSFTWSQNNPDVKVTLQGGGNWANLGTDLRLVDKDQANMSLVPDANLESYTYHETGHLLGLVHEHQRPEIVNDIDPAKAIAWYGATYHWPEGVTRANVLTPWPAGDLYGTTPDRLSIMAYHLDPSIMKPGTMPVPGGQVISPSDCQLIQTIYPRTPPATEITTRKQWEALRDKGQVYCDFFEGGPGQEHESSADVMIDPKAGMSLTCRLRIMANGVYYSDSDIITVKPDGQSHNTGVARNPGRPYSAYLIFTDGNAFDGRSFH